MIAKLKNRKALIGFIVSVLLNVLQATGLLEDTPVPPAVIAE